MLSSSWGFWYLHTIMELPYLTLLCIPFPTALSLKDREMAS